LSKHIKNKRIKTIITASWIGIVGNAIISLLKLIFGFLSGSLAVVSDGIDSAADILTSLITLITAKIMGKPPNKNYPYGYRRAETIATKSLSFFIFFGGAQLAISAITNLITGAEHSIPSLSAFIVTGISIIGKVFLAIYKTKIGKKVSSSMLIANGKNMVNDVVISVVVMIGLVFTHIFHLPILDIITGLAVSLWIMKVAFEIYMESSTELMDGIEDTTLYTKIFEAVDNVPGAENPHRTRIRKIGNLYAIVLDIEVDANLSVLQAHKIAVDTEKEIKKSIQNVYDVLIHTEPQGNVEAEQYGISADTKSNTI
jgi:cation diffusion facilitator family transporter